LASGVIGRPLTAAAPLRARLAAAPSPAPVSAMRISRGGFPERLAEGGVRARRPVAPASREGVGDIGVEAQRGLAASASSAGPRGPDQLLAVTDFRARE